MRTIDVFRVIHSPFVGDTEPWLVVNLGTGVVAYRFAEWSLADQMARQSNRIYHHRWKLKAAVRAEAVRP